jgi:hypothetical protein
VDEFTSAERALTANHAVVQTIGDDDLNRRTPCRDFDVAALADHLIDTISRLGTAAGVQPVDPDGARRIRSTGTSVHRSPSARSAHRVHRPRPTSDEPRRRILPGLSIASATWTFGRTTASACSLWIRRLWPPPH